METCLNATAVVQSNFWSEDMEWFREMRLSNGKRNVCTLLIVFLLSLVGCGGSGTKSAQNPQPNTTALLVNLGDAPSDRLVAVSMKIASMTLANAGGGSVTVVSSSTPVEMMHLMGTVGPLSLMNVPQGTYSGASLSISSATVMYMDPTTMLLVQKSVSGPMTAMINFSPNLIVGTSPMILNLDMNMASSVSIDQSGNVTLTPALTATMNPRGSGNSQDPENGGMEHMTGTVMSVSGNSFMMAMMQSSQSISVTTGSATQFEGVGGMSGMSNGMIVMVDATMQSDGTFMAQTVDSVMSMSSGSTAGGLVTSTTGNPVTQLTLAVQDGAGSGMMGSYLAGMTTVHVSPTATFNIDSDNVDISNLPFSPTFDGATLFKGQSVRADSSIGMMPSGGMGGMMGGGTISGSEIDLEEQGLSGTVSGYTGAAAPTTFTLTLPSDSVFTILTGSTTVTVFQQAGTQLWGLTTLTNGNNVHVRGLLFFDAGAYKLVAGRIMAP